MGITLGASVRLMMSSWFGRRWSMIDSAVQDTVLPIFWVEVASSAKPAQLSRVKPLLWARAAQRALRLHANLAAAAFSTVAIFCLAVAWVLRSGDAAEAPGGSGDAVAVREPLLPQSHPVAAEEGSPPPEDPQQQSEQQAAEAKPGLGGGLLNRLRGGSSTLEAAPQ